MSRKALHVEVAKRFGASCLFTRGGCKCNQRCPHFRLGLHGLSNHLLGTPWPKVERLRAALSNALDSSDDPFPLLLEALADQRPVAADELTAVPTSGDTHPLTRTPFIADARYGTRASTLVSITHDGVLRFLERSWTWQGGTAAVTGERSLVLRP